MSKVEGLISFSCRYDFLFKAFTLSISLGLFYSLLLIPVLWHFSRSGAEIQRD